MKKYDNYLIHPEDNNNIKYWALKLDVSPRQLISAILETGSLSILQIKTYLKKDAWFYPPLIIIKRTIIAIVRLLT
jgi:hypothetical protein